MNNVSEKPPKKALYKPDFVKKGWGYELWAINLGYCGKVLFFERGKKCSWHKHKIKDEAFFLIEGLLYIRFSEDDDLENAEEVIMHPGDCFHVSTGLYHQMEGIEDSKLLEFSTTHREDDSYRSVKGD